VLILGAGQRGLAAVLARTAGGRTIIVTGRARCLAKLAGAEFGSDHTIDVEAGTPCARVPRHHRRAGADIVLELTPMASGADPGRGARRPVGRAWCSPG
jgi:threonine dehydrogenase-like Zn-dependent dehydrogenase